MTKSEVIKQILAVYSVLMGVAMLGVMTWLCVSAYQTGEWSIMLHFNVLGEGLFELIALPVVTIVGVVSMFFSIPRIVPKKKAL